MMYKKIIFAVLPALLLAGTVLAVQISVPSAPSDGYNLTSTTTGAYVSTSTSVITGGFFNATTTATSTFKGPISFAGVGSLFNVTGSVAAFAQLSNMNATNFALAQQSGGHTHLNAQGAVSNGGIGFHLDGAASEYGTLDYRGWTFSTTTSMTDVTMNNATSTFLVATNTASTSVLSVSSYADFHGIANPASPPAGTARFHALTTNGFTRFEQDNEAATNLTLGRDNVFIAKNTTVSTITKGSPVYVTGSTGAVPNIALAKADATSTLPQIGLALDDITSNAFGQVMVVGIINSINTNAFATGDQLWVSQTTAGALTNIRPPYPNFVARIGSVLNKGIGNGSILVDIAPFIGGQENGTTQSFTVGNGLTANDATTTNLAVTNIASTSILVASASSTLQRVGISGALFSTNTGTSSFAGGIQFSGTGNICTAGGKCLGASGSQTPWTSDINGAGFRLQNVGWTGIGTSTAGSLFSLAATSTATQALNTFLLSGVNTVYASSSTSTIQSSRNALSFATSPTAATILSLDGANTRVGIATGTPGTTFSVNGRTGLALQSSTNAAPILTINDPGRGFTGILAATNPGDTFNGFYLGTPNILPLFLGTNGTERLRILSSGEIGIATTSPLGLLSIHAIAGATDKNLFIVASSTVSATTTLFQIDNNGQASTTNLVISGLGNGSTQCLQINNQGVVTGTASACAGGGTVTSITAGDGLLGGTITNSGTIYAQLGTSTLPVLNQIPYYASLGSATAPAKFASVGTSTVSAGTGISLSANPGALVGGSALTITNNGVISVSCTTITCSGTNPASFSIGTNAIALSQLAQVSPNTVLGNNTGVSGNVVAFATSSLGIALSDTTGTLSVSRGGTGQSTFTSSQLLYGNGTNALSSVATTSLTAAGVLSLSQPISVLGTSASQLTVTGGTNGQVLGWLSGVPTWTASSSVSAGTGITVSASGAVTTVTNSGVISNSCPGGFLSCSGTNPSTFTLGTLTVANGGTNVTSLPGSVLLAANGAGTSLIGTSTPSFNNFLATSTTQTSIIAGQLQVASSTSGTINFGSGTATSSLDLGSATVIEKQYPTFTVASTSLLTGTTTIPLGTAIVKETWNQVVCRTDTGTANVQFYNSSLLMTMVAASTASSTATLSTNNVLPALTNRKVDIGTLGSSPNYVTCTIDKTVNK